MSVTYEWDCETVADGDSPEHKDGECIDHHHCASFAEASVSALRTPEPGTKYAIVLVRDDDAGRSWAYLESGMLPECFTDANGAVTARVPRRFTRQVA